MTENWLQNENKTRQDFQEDTQQPIFYKKCLRNPPIYGILIIVIFAVTVPLLIYYFVINNGTYEDFGDHTCSVNQTFRVPCGNPNATQQYCQEINCCFDKPLKLCFHYIPSKYYYKSDKSNIKNFKSTQQFTPYKTKTSNDITWTFSELDANRSKIVLHSKAVTATANVITGDKNYVLRQQFNNKLEVQLYRKDNKTLLLTTTLGPTIISDKYWEWTVQLTEDYLFGLGNTFMAPNTTLTKVIYSNSMNPDTLPVFIAKKSDHFHGLIVRHDGLLEVTVLPSKLIILKSLTGRRIELEVSVGETLRDVIQQQKKTSLSSSIDLKMLGVHICREGKTWNLDDMINEYNALDMTDIDISSDCMHSNLFFALQLLNKSFNDLKTDRDFVLVIPPQIIKNSTFYTNYKDNMVVYQNQSKIDYTGLYLGEEVVYPYFQDQYFQDNYGKNINDEIKARFTNIPSKFMLYNNWPMDESNNNSILEGYAYKSEIITNSTMFSLPWNATAANLLHLSEHNAYGSQQIQLIQNMLQNVPNPFIISAAHNFDANVAVHIQNMDISWSNLKIAIQKMLYNSIFGFPLVAIPICGSTSKYDPKLHESLCIRWYLMASTAPIFYISSEKPYRYPNLLHTKYATNIAKKAIQIRSSLSWYFYSTFNENEPLTRPLFYNFINDNNTYQLDEEYMVGNCLLVAHPVLPDKTQINVYLPQEIGMWYEYWGGEAFKQNLTKKGWLQINVVESDWIGFIAGGSILPVKTETETEIFLKPIVALDENLAATGFVWIEKDKFQFSATDSALVLERITKTATGTQNIFIENIVYYDATKHYGLLCGRVNVLAIDKTAEIDFKSCTPQESFTILD